MQTLGGGVFDRAGQKSRTVGTPEGGVLPGAPGVFGTPKKPTCDLRGMFLRTVPPQITSI